MNSSLDTDLPKFALCNFKLSLIKYHGVHSILAQYSILITFFSQKPEGANGVAASGDRKRSGSSSSGSAVAKKEEKKKTNDEAKSTAQVVSESTKIQVGEKGGSKFH